MVTRLPVTRLILELGPHRSGFVLRPTCCSLCPVGLSPGARPGGASRKVQGAPLGLYLNPPRPSACPLNLARPEARPGFYSCLHHHRPVPASPACLPEGEQEMRCFAGFPTWKTTVMHPSFLCSCDHVVDAAWGPSPSPDVVSSCLGIQICDKGCE